MINNLRLGNRAFTARDELPKGDLMRVSQEISINFNGLCKSRTWRVITVRGFLFAFGDNEEERREEEERESGFWYLPSATRS